MQTKIFHTNLTVEVTEPHMGALFLPVRSYIADGPTSTVIHK